MYRQPPAKSKGIFKAISDNSDKKKIALSPNLVYEVLLLLIIKCSMRFFKFLSRANNSFELLAKR